MTKCLVTETSSSSVTIFVVNNYRNIHILPYLPSALRMISNPVSAITMLPLLIPVCIASACFALQTSGAGIHQLFGIWFD